MTYIIENASILSSHCHEQTSLLIKQERIASVQTTFNKLTHMRMDAKPFIMTPTFVILEHFTPIENDFQALKTHFIKNFIQKGSTTLLTSVDVQYEHEFSMKLKQKKSRLNTCPIDYVIAVKIPISLLTPSLVRRCKREKTPAIFVVIESTQELFNIPWGWIREAMFPYNCPLIPIFSSEIGREKQQLINEWNKIISKEKIPSLLNEIPEHEPVSKQELAKIGIYPVKSNLQQGGEVSYNFFFASQESRQVDELELFHYHSHRLVVTVHKGKVIRAGENVIFHSGYGEHVKINTPSFYTL